MGGELTAASDGLGKGATMTFSIPLRTPALDVEHAVPPAVSAAMEHEYVAAGALPPAEVELLPPLDAQPASSRSSPSPPCSPSALLPPQLRQANVLVAEDDLLSQAVMRKVLQRLGLRFTLVENGAAAVEAYRNGACCVLASVASVPFSHASCSAHAADVYNIVLMDLQYARWRACLSARFSADVAAVCARSMPILDGLGAARAICGLIARGERPPAPIVVRNGMHTLERNTYADARVLRATGADGVLQRGGARALRRGGLCGAPTQAHQAGRAVRAAAAPPRRRAGGAGSSGVRVSGLRCWRACDGQTEFAKACTTRIARRNK
jgi:CheY-like chemotaxis protein